jgi:hypothetical protein
LHERRRCLALPHRLKHGSLPREIRITKAIGEVKKAILKGFRDIPVRQAAGKTSEHFSARRSLDPPLSHLSGRGP